MINIFDICNYSKYCEDVIFSVGEDCGNTNLILAINNNIDAQVYAYSNEWLYLIHAYREQNHPYYDQLTHFFYNIYNNKHLIHVVNENVISFITCFSRGTVHGYSGLYNNIIEYLNNYEKYKDLKIIVSVNSQQGILDIINHLCNMNIIDRNKIIYLEKNVIYHFHSITFIENKYHVINLELAYKISELINKYIIPNKNDLLYYKSLNLPDNLENICIIKNSNSTNLTGDGVVPFDRVINYCNRCNVTNIEPSTMSEIPLIHAINRCKNLIISWGTAFMKNYTYISDYCEKIIVLVIGNGFITQYNDHCRVNALTFKFKNATISYIIVDELLNHDLII